MKIGLHSSNLKAALGRMNGSRTFGGPVQAHFALTERCNLNCVLCHFKSHYRDIPLYPPVRKALWDEVEKPQKIKKTGNRPDPVSDRIRKCIDELINLGTSRFEFNACGEPFLHKNILEFVERMKHSKRYLTGFTRNFC